MPIASVIFLDQSRVSQLNDDKPPTRQAMYCTYNVTSRRVRVKPLLMWKSNEYCTTCVCICSLRYPACNAHARCCHLCLLFYYLINGTIFEKKKSYWKRNVFWFSP